MRIRVISCETIDDEIKRALELEAVSAEWTFLDHGLHQRPEQMAGEIQKAIDTPGDPELILLGFGLCSNGVLGIKARRCPVAIPRVEDCIALLLGSNEAYQREFNSEPGTYYFTRGWIVHGDDPLKVYERYRQKYDEETTVWVLQEMLKNYRRVALIDTGAYDIREYEAYVRRIGDLYNMRYEQIPGSLAFLRRLARGDWDDQFVVLAPGEELTAARFNMQRTRMMQGDFRA